MAFIKKRNTPPKEVSSEALTTPNELINLARSNGIDIAPLNISDLTSLLGIKVYFEPMADDDSGSLSKDKKSGKWIMKINSLHHPHRQRFTMAHELGHYIKHSGLHERFEDTTFFRNGDSNPMETEANKFAGELLMPKDIFNEYVQTNSANIEDIANYFHVSVMAVRVRAKELGYTGHEL